jgi:hypothetical protein
MKEEDSEGEKSAESEGSESEEESDEEESEQEDGQMSEEESSGKEGKGKGEVRAPLGRGKVPKGFSMVSKTVAAKLPITTKKLKNRQVIFRYDPQVGPRGWFLGKISTRAVSKKEQKEGFVVNVAYRNAQTGGKLHGDVATALSMESYGLHKTWVLLSPTTSKGDASRASKAKAAQGRNKKSSRG